MAGHGGIARLLERVRPKLVQELDINKVFPRLLRRGILTVSEEKQILGPADPKTRTETLLDFLCQKDRNVFADFCKTLEECPPQLLTCIVLESQQGKSNI
ncbi:hypothetical protein RRG08_030581 [Elysia crispata]|uniref:CARD domain-containing protein n=1 Tax=Elysia crispata TaxID=231223 RepID=A0AAE0Z6H1_9GAST|nr:hypothetical protein RRG08_030581 [Elysia crispata]